MPTTPESRVHLVQYRFPNVLTSEWTTEVAFRVYEAARDYKTAKEKRLASAGFHNTVYRIHSVTLL